MKAALAEDSFSISEMTPKCNFGIADLNLAPVSHILHCKPLTPISFRGTQKLPKGVEPFLLKSACALNQGQYILSLA